MWKFINRSLPLFWYKILDCRMDSMDITITLRWSWWWQNNFLWRLSFNALDKIWFKIIFNSLRAKCKALILNCFQLNINIPSNGSFQFKRQMLSTFALHLHLWPELLNTFLSCYLKKVLSTLFSIFENLWAQMSFLQCN